MAGVGMTIPVSDAHCLTVMIITKDQFRRQSGHRIVPIDITYVFFGLEDLMDVGANPGFTKGNDCLEGESHASQGRHGPPKAVPRDPDGNTADCRIKLWGNQAPQFVNFTEKTGVNLHIIRMIKTGLLEYQVSQNIVVEEKQALLIKSQLMNTHDAKPAKDAKPALLG